VLPLAAEPAVVRAADAVGVPPSPPLAATLTSGGESERTLGTVVHRLMERLGTVPPDDRDAIQEAALRALRPEESAALDDREAFAARAAAAYRALCQHPEVRRFYASDVLHEVPFTAIHGGRVVRGSIDCLARVSPDEVMVLEFKTGRSRPEHAAQLDVYVHVATQLFPGATVGSRLIYANLGPSPEPV
jgi:ATP-dependent exoDNAse (exonuclease V) beta subunit